VDAIAEKIGRCRETILNVRKRLGLKKNRKGLSREEHAKVVALLRSGDYTAIAIARQEHLPYYRVREVRQELAQTIQHKIRVVGTGSAAVPSVPVISGEGKIVLPDEYIATAVGIVQKIIDNPWLSALLDDEAITDGLTQAVRRTAYKDKSETEIHRFFETVRRACRIARGERYPVDGQVN
jgi:hypothetical protein